MIIDQPTLVVPKTDVRTTWDRHGFIPTTDEQRARNQRKNPHSEQCLCRFCQAEKEVA